MIITDIPQLAKKIEGKVAYNLFDFRIKKNNEIYKIRKNLALHKQIAAEDELIAIIHPSSYKLLYELTHCFNDKSVRSYSLQGWQSGNVLEHDPKQNEKMFDEYMHRSYATKTFYRGALMPNNLLRIEQLMILAVIANDIVGSKKLPDHFVTLFFRLLDEKQNIGRAVDLLVYNAANDNISDVFADDFIVLNHDCLLMKHCTELKLRETMAMRQLQYMAELMPLVNAVKTLSYLEKQGLVLYNGERFVINSGNDFVKYEQFTDKKMWVSYYKKPFNELFDVFIPVNDSRLTFICPRCNGREVGSDRNKFYCRTKECSFKVGKWINVGGKRQQITEIDLLKLLNNEQVSIKNRIGGYSFYRLKESDRGNYVVIPKV